MNGNPSGVASPGELKLTVVAGPRKGREYSFTEHDTFVFGRAPECHCALPEDDYLSARHFLIEVNPPEGVLWDLGSKNGTRVNGVLSGRRAKGEAPDAASALAKVLTLRDGDLIEAGASEFRVSIRRPIVDAVDEDIGDGGFPEIPGYRVERKLREGGMGLVLLAKRVKDARTMAVKVIKARRGSADDWQRKQFQREMETCVRLFPEAAHRNIAGFAEAGAAGGVLYFSMEYYPHGSVWNLMREHGGRLPVRLAVDLAAQALDGLAFAHAKDVVHRDVKPENILLAKQDGAWVAKVADFGLAKNYALAGLSGMTATGSSGAGTPAFMPKEQLLEYRDTKPVSDVFSMGASLYNMLTGMFVYDGQDIIVDVVNGMVVSLGARGIDLPRSLIEVVDKAIAPEARDRFQSAVEFQTALLRTV